MTVPVIFVSSHAKAGGAERYLVSLIEALGPGWVRAVVCLEDGPLVERLRTLGVEPSILPTGGGPRALVHAARRLRAVLNEQRPAVVHANGIKAALVSSLAATRSGLPIVWVKHDFTLDGPIVWGVAARAREVVAVSHAVAETFPQRLRRKVTVVNNGIKPLATDRGEGRRRLLEALGGSETARVVILVGRLEPGKGQADLVAIAPELAARAPGTRVALVGGENARVPSYAAELRRDAGEAVSFLGHRDDAVELISGADVLVIPSVVGERGMGREGFPYVGLEGLAVGTPVVGYAHGGLPELVGECGRLVPPGDRAALADAIVSLLEDEDERARVARCGVERLHAHFTLDRMVETMKERYTVAAKPAR